VTRARVCILLLALAGLVGAAVWFGQSLGGAGRVDRPPSASSAPAAPGARNAAAALGILHAWDADRSTAYASGRAAPLRELYVPGSSAGRADVELLRRYHRRGLRVTGMRTQVLSLAVLVHRADLWRLRVTDRLVGAVAVGHGSRTTLPRDLPSAHEITLMRADHGKWRVAGVREVSRVRP
jgi:hypothetical protein